ncbi:WD40 repeat-like protein [Coprinellus micaceus]|uniref:WD40 repeat-like protein n=1 Tax=Coprinellus micaceus TaxID=71717 RepID=A0A4Y7TJ65_COPMI|nr:WD40 repeat-like protein [Coprinellus micaceus]
MSEPDPSKFSFRRWARGVKEDVKDGFKQIVRSTPPTPSPSPGSHSRSADHGVEGSTTSTPAAEHAINDTLRVPIASPYPTRPQSTPPTLLAAPSQLERLPSAIAIVSSSEEQTNHSVIESSQTVAPDLAQYESEPIAQEAARTNHPQAPFALHEAIPAHIPIVDTQQALQTSTSANLQPSSNLGPLANPSGGSTDVQKGEEKPSSPWYAGIRTTLALVERAADAFPPLKSTVAGINGILDIYHAFDDNKRDFERLAERVKLVDAILRSSPQDAPQEFKDRRDGLGRTLNGLAENLKGKGDRKRLERLARSKEDQQEIVRLIREVSFAIEIAMTLILQVVKGINWLKDRQGEEYKTIQEPIARIDKGVAALCKAETLKSLGDVKNFAFSNGTRRRECVPGSRVGLLSELLTWGVDRKTAHAFWLSGMAGTGKTAVSETFCSQLSKRRLLGASFFCSLTSTELSDVRAIIPSLARALAKARPEFGNALAAILDEELSQGNDPLLMKIPAQYEYLILAPAKEAFRDSDENVILAVDALDECRDQEALLEFLEVVLSTKPPAALKIFLTSRPESLIREPMELSSTPSRPQLCRLHDIEHDVVRADIELFVHHELEKVIRPLKVAYQGNWPPLEAQNIVERSGTLFIIAATIMRYICDKAGDTVERFREFHKSDAAIPSGIYSLYQSILEAAFGTLTPKEKENGLSCLSLLVVALRPLSVTEYSGLLDLPIHTIRAAFTSLHSVVQVPPDGHDDQLICIYHASFVDFLTNQQSTTPTSFPWTIDRPAAHSMVAEHCFRTMNTKLQFNIANIPSSFILDCDNPHLPTEVEQNIPPHLRYACLGWSQHLSMIIPDPMHPLVAILSGFIQLKVLFWIEAMNLLNSALQCNPALCRASEWLEKHDHKDSATLAHQLKDTGAFVLYFSASPASQSTPHLYISSLATSPSHLGLVPAWKNHFPGIPTLQTHSSWSTPLMRINVGSQVWGVAVSPDGKCIASGSEDGLVRIWDAQDGKEVEVLEGHSQCVNSVAFSGDGQHLASGSADCTVRLWDVMAGKEGNVLQGHMDMVTSVALSNSGKELVSGSEDGSVRVWDTTTGEEMVVLDGQTRAVYSVAFSSDGIQIASGSEDHTVRVWDWRLGKELLVLKGHTWGVMSVTFSADGMWIASGSDNDVRVWNARTGQEERAIDTQTGTMQSVAFSKDGTQILSGSEGGTLKLWDVETGRELQAFQGHTNHITSAVFSSDGRRIISGSLDGFIGVWDRTGARKTEQRLQGHTLLVNSAVFSEDGSQIVSGSLDGLVQVWDGRTGEQLKRLDGHTAYVRTVVLSPDGTRIASGSGDNSVRVWDTATGQELLVLQGHTWTVYSVVFLPGGTSIVSASGDGTVRTWDVVTGEELMVVEGDRGVDHSAQFSSDGSCIASGSWDGIVQIWDVAEGKQLKVLEGHTDGVCSVGFSPDGTCVASGSNDGTVCIWDADTGEVQMVLSGHVGPIHSVAFSCNSTHIASASMDGTVRVWDLTTGKEHLVLRGHIGQVRLVAFSRDGTRIVSGSSDMTLRVWDLEGLSYSSEIIKDQATGWLLAPDNRQNHLMYAPLTLVPQSPCSLIISGNSAIPSFSSPPTFSFDAIGDNWQKCFTPLP